MSARIVSEAIRRVVERPRVRALSRSAALAAAIFAQTPSSAEPGGEGLEELR
jgi:hypothetical protein